LLLAGSGALVVAYTHPVGVVQLVQGEAGLQGVVKTHIVVLTGVKLEPSLQDAAVGKSYQFERQGYFCADKDSKPGALVFNRAVSLRDTWAKIEKKKG
jgi:glutaminyl-tRNA synthetase